jgi:nucleotide-binding universal stress UspA family protein
VDQRERDALRRARDIAWRYGHEIETQLRRGRDAARPIVLEARCIDADAIFLPLGLPRFSWLPPRLSRTVRDVLRQAPCPVFFGYFPSAGALEASRAVAEAERLLAHTS